LRQYETVYIIDPQLDEDQQNALVQRFHTLLTDQGCQIDHTDRWERRRLAYEIKGRREGYYVVVNFRGEPAAEAELDRVFRITDGVLRHLIVRMDERLAARQIAEAKAAADAKAKAQAEARAAAEAAEAEAAAEAARLEAEAGRAAPAPSPVAAAAVESEPEPSEEPAGEAEEPAEEAAAAEEPAAEEPEAPPEESTGPQGEEPQGGVGEEETESVKE
jgi:small subunit ribosomal protein S6